MILVHIVLALGSIFIAVSNFLSPRKLKQDVSFIAASLTLASGVSLIFINNASVLRTCLTGMIFFAGITALNIAAGRKLAKSTSSKY